LRIHVNGQSQEVEVSLSLTDLISSLNLRPEQIAIELNQMVVRRMHWPETMLREDDRVEIVHFVGGGNL
jgi:thiamine biosynthesis protein ThiS